MILHAARPNLNDAIAMFADICSDLQGPHLTRVFHLLSSAMSVLSAVSLACHSHRLVNKDRQLANPQVHMAALGPPGFSDPPCGRQG